MSRDPRLILRKVRENVPPRNSCPACEYSALWRASPLVTFEINRIGETGHPQWCDYDSHLLGLSRPPFVLLKERSKEA